MWQRHNHKKGFELLRSNSATIAHKTRMGFNLVEAAVVLGVVGVVIGAIWYAASAFRDELKIRETQKVIVSFCDKITNFYPISVPIPDSNETMSVTFARTVKLYPESWFINNGTVVTPLNLPPLANSVSIIRYADSASNGTAVRGGDISIHLLNIPKRYCRKLLENIDRKSNSLIYSITIGTGWWDTHTDYLFPYNGDMSGACNDGPLLHFRFVCTAN